MATGTTTTASKKKPAAAEKNTQTATVALAHGEQINTRTGHIEERPTASKPRWIISTNASGGATSSRMRLSIPHADVIQLTESGEGKPATIVYRAKPGIVLSYTGEFTEEDNGDLTSRRILSKSGEVKTTTIFGHNSHLVNFIPKSQPASNMKPKGDAKADAPKKKAAKPATKPASAAAE